MTKIEMTEKIIISKKELGFSWEDIASKVDISPVFLTSACLGMNSLLKKQANKVCDVLKLDKNVSKTLQEFSHKQWEKTVPTDPVVYRFYEIVGVYGDTIKELLVKNLVME